MEILDWAFWPVLMLTVLTLALILAVGIVGNVENLGLETLGVKVEKTHIVVDGLGKTNVPGLYAIGDVTGPPWLAHKAMHEGVIVVEGMSGKAPSHKFDPWNVPGCTYSHPQVASVGMTEEKAKASGRKIKVGKFPFIGNGKAIALGELNGDLGFGACEAVQMLKAVPDAGREVVHAGQAQQGKLGLSGNRCGTGKPGVVTGGNERLCRSVLAQAGTNEFLQVSQYAGLKRPTAALFQ